MAGRRGNRSTHEEHRDEVLAAQRRRRSSSTVKRIAKVAFQLEPDGDGHPPIAVELLNATPIGDGVFCLDNAPSFAPEVAYGDVVRARPTDIEDQHLFDELVEESGFTSISIILLDSAMDSFLKDLLRGHQCVIEYGEFGKFRMLAVAVPATENYSNLRRQLTELEGQGKLSFAELAIAGS